MLMLKGSSQPYYSRVGNKRGNKLQKTLQVSSNLKKKSRGREEVQIWLFQEQLDAENCRNPGQHTSETGDIPTWGSPP